MREDVIEKRVCGLASPEKLLLAHMDAIDLALDLTLHARQFFLKIYDGVTADDQKINIAMGLQIIAGIRTVNISRFDPGHLSGGLAEHGFHAGRFHDDSPEFVI